MTDHPIFYSKTWLTLGELASASKDFDNPGKPLTWHERKQTLEDACRDAALGKVNHCGKNHLWQGSKVRITAFRDWATLRPETYWRQLAERWSAEVVEANAPTSVNSGRNLGPTSAPVSIADLQAFLATTNVAAMTRGQQKVAARSHFQDRNVPERRFRAAIKGLPARKPGREN